MYFSKTVAVALFSLLSLASAAPIDAEPVLELELRAPENATLAAGPELERRANSGSFTYYNVGLGACGQTNKDSDFIAAVGASRFDQNTPNGNPNKNTLCGKKIKISYKGKSTTVTVRDRCPGCGYNDLDLSPAAFRALAPQSVGRISGTWVYTS